MTPEQEALQWVARNGLPYPELLERSIEFSDAHDDPFNENPFRRALLALTNERTVS